MATKEQELFDGLTFELLWHDINSARKQMGDLVRCIMKGKVFQVTGLDVVVVPATKETRRLARRFAKTFK